MSSSATADEVGRLERRREARQRAAADLKATRARLAAGTSIKPEFEYELLAMYVRSELGAAVTMPALYALFAIASMFWSPVLEGDAAGLAATVSELATGRIPAEAPEPAAEVAVALDPDDGLELPGSRAAS